MLIADVQICREFLVIVVIQDSRMRKSPYGCRLPQSLYQKSTDAQSKRENPVFEEKFSGITTLLSWYSQEITHVEGEQRGFEAGGKVCLVMDNC